MIFNDSKILENIRNKDVKSYNELYALYAEKLYFFALKFVAPESAEDIIQDVFLYIWTNSESIDIKKSFRSFLFSLVKNRCLNQIKHKSVEHRYKDYALHKIKELEIQHYSNSENTILEKELESALKYHINNLPSQSKKIFELSRFSYKKNLEVAEELNISIKTVEKHITFSLKTLRKKMSVFF